MSKTCHDCIWVDECDLNNLVEYIRNQIDSETMLLETCSDTRQKNFHQGRLSAFESMLEDRERIDIFMNKEEITDKLVEDIRNLLAGNIDPSRTGTINYLTYKLKAVFLQYAEQLKE